MRNIVIKISKAFGSDAELARALSVTPGAVSRWRTRGRIPLMQQRRLLDVAEERGLDLLPEDVICYPPPQSARATD